ncbi:MAG: DUF2277 domain-containing protein [Polyangiaceae bacterium]|nr:DUF2277 domain-containing protein [Polyangiaceae bacterium]
MKDTAVLEPGTGHADLWCMCRNIRPLFNFAPPATDEEVLAAALQYVRKVSGQRRPAEPWGPPA